MAVFKNICGSESKCIKNNFQSLQTRNNNRMKQKSNRLP